MILIIVKLLLTVSLALTVAEFAPGPGVPETTTDPVAMTLTTKTDGPIRQQLTGWRSLALM